MVIFAQHLTKTNVLCIFKIAQKSSVIHRVHEKTITLYMCHNSGKQRRILTKFYTNTARLYCKQDTKFQQNRSTSATVKTVPAL